MRYNILPFFNENYSINFHTHISIDQVTQVVQSKYLITIHRWQLLLASHLSAEDVHPNCQESIRG